MTVFKAKGGAKRKNVNAIKDKMSAPQTEYRYVFYRMPHLPTTALTSVKCCCFLINRNIRTKAPKVSLGSVTEAPGSCIRKKPLKHYQVQ